MYEIYCVVQTFKKEFADYMSAYEHPTVRMFDPFKYVIRSKVLIREGKNHCVKFGEGWKYKVDDVVQFECKDAYCSRAIYVTKMGCNRKHG
jgi:hypothetical protein